MSPENLCCSLYGRFVVLYHGDLRQYAFQMEKTVLTFGDSNTHGTPPMGSLDHHPRLSKRWPVIMAGAAGVTLIEEGLGGRLAASHGDPIMGDQMNGQLGLRIALASHGPIDLLTIMLGTNDFQAHHGKTVDQIAGHMDGLLKIAQLPELQDRHGGYEVLVIAPPPVKARGIFAPDFANAVVPSQSLGLLYAEIAQRRSMHFLDAGQHITSSDIDGIHFDENAHATLGRAVADQIKTFLI